MSAPCVLHCLAQLPTRTGSGVYFRNLLAEFKQTLPGRQLALYGRTAEAQLDFLVADKEFPVVFAKSQVAGSAKPAQSFQETTPSGSATPANAAPSKCVGPTQQTASGPTKPSEEVDLPFPICGMSDEMPYASTVFCQMSEYQLTLYQEAFRSKLEEIRTQDSPDLIICHHLWILARLVLEVFPDTPVLAICHGTDLRQAQQHPDLKDRYVGNLTGLAAVAALSQLQVPELQAIYQLDPRKIRVTGGAYDHRVFKPAASAQRQASSGASNSDSYNNCDSCENVPWSSNSDNSSNSDTINYLYAGKIARAKGVYELAAAFNLLTEEIPQAHLDLVGGPTPQAAQELARRSQYNSNITLWEAEEQELLAAHMRRSDIFVLPSYYEGLGLIALEALASGLRLVVTDLPALREQMGPELASHEAISWVPMPPLQKLDQPLAATLPDHVQKLKTALQEQAQRLKQIGPPQGTLDLVAPHSWPGLAHKIRRLIHDLIGLDL